MATAPLPGLPRRRHFGSLALGWVFGFNELLALIAVEPTISMLVSAASTGPEGRVVSYLTGKRAARLGNADHDDPSGFHLAEVHKLSGRLEPVGAPPAGEGR